MSLVDGLVYLYWFKRRLPHQVNPTKYSVNCTNSVHMTVNDNQTLPLNSLNEFTYSPILYCFFPLAVIVSEVNQ